MRGIEEYRSRSDGRKKDAIKLKYSSVYTKIISGKEERVIGVRTFFWYDGYDKNIIETWLSNHSIICVLKCFFKSWWNKKTIREKAISHIDLQKNYEELQQTMLKSYEAQLREKKQGAETNEK